MSYRKLRPALTSLVPNDAGRTDVVERCAPLKIGVRQDMVIERDHLLQVVCANYNVSEHLLPSIT